MKQYVIILLITCAAAAFGQDITNTLGSGGTFSVKDSANTFLTLKQSTGLTGIGANATNPRASLEVGGTDGLLATGSVGSGTALNLGAGTRLHWYPRKAAFRAGVADGAWWDDANIGNYSVAMGYQTRATGSEALAMGSGCRATNTRAVAVGYYCIASGHASRAIGSNANTNGFEGAMVITDHSVGIVSTYATQNDQLTMRFDGGYQLFSDMTHTSGVYMNSHASGWTNYCDRNRKENFRELDGEEVLGKIRGMPVTEWNYKRAPSLKYIGTVAQDFYDAFGLCGDDSTGINTICIDGVNLAGVQALEKRTSRMREEIEHLRTQNETLHTENENLRSNVKTIEAMLTTQQSALDKIRKELASLKSGAADRAGSDTQQAPLALTNANSK